MENNQGTSLITIITVIFIVLKILGFINWSWIWVLSPIWITGLFIIGLAVYIMFKNKEK